MGYRRVSETEAGGIEGCALDVVEVLEIDVNMGRADLPHIEIGRLEINNERTTTSDQHTTWPEGERANPDLRCCQELMHVPSVSVSGSGLCGEATEDGRGARVRCWLLEDLLADLRGDGEHSRVQ